MMAELKTIYPVEHEYRNILSRNKATKTEETSLKEENINFYKLADIVKEHINAILSAKSKNDKSTTSSQDNSQDEASKEAIKIQYDAIRGVPEMVDYFISHIEAYLKDNNYSKISHPKWYPTLAEGLFHEVWGLGCISNFFEDRKYAESSSAKVIGDKVFYLIDGVQTLQPQRMTAEKYSQIKKNLLTNARFNNNRDSYVELNMITGERVSLVCNSLTKPGQEMMILRKYTANKLTWSEQAALKTIPEESIDLFTEWAKVGYNVIFTGQVRSGKTTWLNIWQKCENRFLEGIMIEATDEIRLHEMMPSAPNGQLLIPDSPEEKQDMKKVIARSDLNYLIYAEARQGDEYALMVDLANKGATRCKATMHSSDGKDVVQDITDEIINVTGEGNLNSQIFKVAKSFHYVFELSQTFNANHIKKLKAIYEVRQDREKGIVSTIAVCLYHPLEDRWEFNADIGEDKERIAQFQDYEAFIRFKSELVKLAAKYPMNEKDKNEYIIYNREWSK